MRRLAKGFWENPAYGAAPRALFYHTIDPHRRDPDGAGRLWWAVDEDAYLDRTKGWDELPIPHIEDLPGDGNDVQRFKQVVETTDTIIFDLLQEIGIVDLDGNYDSDTKTVVFFLADNGTDPRVSAVNARLPGTNANRAKNSPYEGGIRVPCFVFGENITGVPGFGGTVTSQLITHVDFFETICDIVDAPESARTNPAGLGNEGEFERHGISFADAINWHDTPIDDRPWSVTSFGFRRGSPEKDLWQVVMTDGDHKLICRGGGEGFVPILPPTNCDDTSTEPTYLTCVPDLFFDLENDPDETINLVNQIDLWNAENRTISRSELLKYLQMRDALVDYWPTAVSVPHGAADLPAYSVAIAEEEYALRVYVNNGEVIDCGTEIVTDEFYRLDTQEELLQGGCTLSDPVEQDIYLTLRNQIVGQVATNGGTPGFAVVDVAATDYLTLSSVSVDPPPFGGIGFLVDENLGPVSELRSFIKFEPDTWPVPFGIGSEKLASAQIVIKFDEDALGERGADSGRIRIHPVNDQIMWTATDFNHSQLWNGFASTVEYGDFDPPPHAVFENNFTVAGFEPRGIPLAPGTPVSFGHSELLLDDVRNWMNGTSNEGVALRSLVIDSRPFVGGNVGDGFGDQRVYFKMEAYLRLVFDESIGSGQ